MILFNYGDGLKIFVYIVGIPIKYVFYNYINFDGILSNSSIWNSISRKNDIKNSKNHCLESTFKFYLASCNLDF